MSKKSLITEEERALFKTAVENVVPLPPNNQLHHATPQQKIRNKNISRNDNLNPLLHRQPLAPLTPVGSEETLTFARSGLQTRVIQRLKRGEFEIDAVLDLHGLNLTEAEQILPNFLTHALEQHWRCVQIIHGKGTRSSQTPPLKNSVNQWLRAYPLVLAFCSAKASDGGAGAVYVLLKSSRP